MRKRGSVRTGDAVASQAGAVEHAAAEMVSGPCSQAAAVVQPTRREVADMAAANAGGDAVIAAAVMATIVAAKMAAAGIATHVAAAVVATKAAPAEVTRVPTEATHVTATHMAATKTAAVATAEAASVAATASVSTASSVATASTTVSECMGRSLLAHQKNCDSCHSQKS